MRMSHQKYNLSKNLIAEPNLQKSWFLKENKKVSGKKMCLFFDQSIPKSLEYIYTRVIGLEKIFSNGVPNSDTIETWFKCRYHLTILMKLVVYKFLIKI